jgi:hypothetical protein
MAFDRPDDDFEAGDARLEQQHLRSCRPGSDVPAARSEPAEPRTHEEYYEALRATDDSSASDGSPASDDSPADDSPASDHHAADSRTDHSAWDSVDTSNRPALDALCVSPERRVHILDGDADGGGGATGMESANPARPSFLPTGAMRKSSLPCWMSHINLISRLLIRIGMTPGSVPAPVTTWKLQL